jgi:DNA recombination protein RmuC
LPHPLILAATHTSAGASVGFILAGVLAGMVIMWLIYRPTREKLGRLEGELGGLREDKARLEAREANQANLETITKALEEQFTNLSNKALKENNTSFLNLAQKDATKDDALRKQAIEAMLKPFREKLGDLDKQFKAVEKDRKEAYGELKNQVAVLTQSEVQMRDETRRLVNALRKPQIRGNWGEMILRRVVEASGMTDHCNFLEQVHVNTGDSILRPDMVVRLPGNAEIIVDAKTPLESYLTWAESTDPAVQAEGLVSHARLVRDHIKKLSQKAYWKQFDRSPEFVIMFIPLEGPLQAAYQQDPKLLEDALSAKVVLASPMTLMTLLWSAYAGWQKVAIAENAEGIRIAGKELYERLSVWLTHLTKVGKKLDEAGNSYNKAVGSLQSRVMPSARRFTELELVSPDEELPAITVVDTVTRALEVEELDSQGDAG